MNLNKIISLSSQDSKRTRSTEEIISDRIQGLLTLKQRIDALHAQKQSIDQDPVYFEGMRTETPSEGFLLLDQKRKRIIQELNGNRRLEIEGLSSQIKNETQDFAHSLVDQKRIFGILDQIDQIDSSLAKEINQYLTKFQVFYQKSLGEEIRKLYSVPAHLPLHLELKEGGASDGFKVRFNGTTVYVKESMTYSQRDKRVNPKELFVYKVLEYAHFGPKAKFIIRPYTTTGRSGANICFIAIIDTEHTKSPAKKSKQFSTDSLQIDDGEITTELWKRALADDSFRSELLSLSMIDDVLLIRDSFRENPGNYGVVQIENQTTGEVRFKPKLIDHLPYSRVAETNGVVFRYDSLASAQRNFNMKVRANLERHETKKSSHLSALGRISAESEISFDGFEKRAIERVLSGKHEKEGSSLHDAVLLAYEEISAEIRLNPDVFIEGAVEKMNEYMAKIQKNMEILALVS